MNRSSRARRIAIYLYTYFRPLFLPRFSIGENEPSHGYIMIWAIDSGDRGFFVSRHCLEALAQFLDPVTWCDILVYVPPFFPARRKTTWPFLLNYGNPFVGVLTRRKSCPYDQR